MRGELIRILGGLMWRKGNLDGIPTETTGLAEPAPVAQFFFVDDDVRRRTKLDAIVTVVDAKHPLSELATVEARICAINPLPRSTVPLRRRSRCRARPRRPQSRQNPRDRARNF